MLRPASIWQFMYSGQYPQHAFTFYCDRCLDGGADTKYGFPKYDSCGQYTPVRPFLASRPLHTQIFQPDVDHIQPFGQILNCLFQHSKYLVPFQATQVERSNGRSLPMCASLTEVLLGC
jgi:hypothetical protein